MSARPSLTEFGEIEVSSSEIEQTLEVIDALCIQGSPASIGERWPGLRGPGCYVDAISEARLVGRGGFGLVYKAEALASLRYLWPESSEAHLDEEVAQMRAVLLFDGAPSAAVVARCEALAAPTPTTLTAATLNTTSVLDGTGWDGGVPAPEPMTNLGSALPVLMLCVRAPTLYLTM